MWQDKGSCHAAQTIVSAGAEAVSGHALEQCFQPVRLLLCCPPQLDMLQSIFYSGLQTE